MVSPIVIAGPTASGKSDLALKLAESRKGELVCADSRQIFVGMTIGTAGPSDRDQARICHHGFGALDPSTFYDAGRFVADTDRYVDEIHARKHTAILVGGTGLYLRAWRFGLSDVPKRDESIRQQLNHESSEFGLQTLYERLQQIDSSAAAKIASNDEMRIIRALEIHALTQQKPSELRQSHQSLKPRVQAKWILLVPDREWLNKRIHDRIVQMFDGGLVEEALLLKQHLGGHALLKTMGYEEALAYAEGVLSKEDAIKKSEVRHRQYAKRQMTWFKKEPWWHRVQPSTDELFRQVSDILDT